MLRLILRGQETPGHHLQREDVKEVFVNAEHPHCQAALSRLHGKILPVAHRSAHKPHAGQLADGLDSFRVKFPQGLAGVLPVIHVDPDDVDPAHEHHILPDFIPYFLPQHRQCDKGGNTERNGQDDAKTALTHDLTQADAKKIRCGYHKILPMAKPRCWK